MTDALPRLRTARLDLRVPTVADAAAFCRFVTENRVHLEPWEPQRAAEYYTVEFWRRELARALDLTRAGIMLRFAVSLRGSPEELLGHCTLSNIVRGPFQAAYLGYALGARAVGHGYMTEALETVMAYAFEALNLHRVMANYMPHNERSARVLERLGFAREGYAREYLHLAGGWRDHVMTARINPAWRPR